MAANEEQENVQVVDNTTTSTIESRVCLANGQVEVTLTPKEVNNPRFCSENARKVTFGLIIVIGIAVSWVSATQFTKSTYSPTFNAPFFIIWFTTCLNVVWYPLYIIGSLLLYKERRQSGLQSLFREDHSIYGNNGLTAVTFFKIVGPFCLLWMATNYVYIRALGNLHVTDVTALFATHTAFVYVFSWIWLVEKIILIPARSFSVLMSILGTVLMCQAEGFQGGRTEGIVLALGSSLGAALYKVLFFRVIGKASYGQVSLFLTLLGLFNGVFLWPIMLVLYLTEVETIDWGNLPTLFLCGSAALSLVFNFLVNFGVAFTFPLFIALGTVLGIPLNAVVDWLFRDAQFGSLMIVGGVLVIIGFLIMLVPESYQRKVACWTEGRCPCEKGQELDHDAALGGEDEEGAEGAVGAQEGNKWTKLEQSDDSL